jgi:hypothetical protein
MLEKGCWRGFTAMTKLRQPTSGMVNMTFDLTKNMQSKRE